MKLNPDQVCFLLNMCLKPNKYKEKHDSTTGWLVSTTIDRVSMEETLEREEHQFQYWTAQTAKQRDGFDMEVCRKAIYTDHQLLSDSHHPMEHKLEVIWTPVGRDHIDKYKRPKTTTLTLGIVRQWKSVVTPHWAFIKNQTDQKQTTIKKGTYPTCGRNFCGFFFPNSKWLYWQYAETEPGLSEQPRYWIGAHLCRWVKTACLQTHAE